MKIARPLPSNASKEKLGQKKKNKTNVVACLWCLSAYTPLSLVIKSPINVAVHANNSFAPRFDMNFSSNSTVYSITG